MPYVWYPKPYAWYPIVIPSPSATLFKQYTYTWTLHIYICIYINHIYTQILVRASEASGLWRLSEPQLLLARVDSLKLDIHTARACFWATEMLEHASELLRYSELLSITVPAFFWANENLIIAARACFWAIDNSIIAARAGFWVDENLINVAQAYSYILKTSQYAARACFIDTEMLKIIVLSLLHAWICMGSYNNICICKLYT